jgi:hypothetical protein
MAKIFDATGLPLPIGSAAKPIIEGEAITEIVGMKHWNDEKQCWDGVVCQARRKDGKEFVLVYDVGSAETQVEIDDFLRHSIATEPWNG